MEAWGGGGGGVEVWMVRGEHSDFASRLPSLLPVKEQELLGGCPTWQTAARLLSRAKIPR